MGKRRILQSLFLFLSILFVQETQGQKVTDTIYYDYGDATIRPDALSALDRVIQLLRANHKLRVKISSYADSIGEAERNIELSERRSQNVERYLIDSGIRVFQFVPREGLGEADPIAPNTKEGRDNPEGRQRNRRTVVLIYDTLLLNGQIDTEQKSETRDEPVDYVYRSPLGDSRIYIIGLMFCSIVIVIFFILRKLFLDFILKTREPPISQEIYIDYKKLTPRDISKLMHSYEQLYRILYFIYTVEPSQQEKLADDWERVVDELLSEHPQDSLEIYSINTGNSITLLLAAGFEKYLKSFLVPPALIAAFTIVNKIVFGKKGWYEHWVEKPGIKLDNNRKRLENIKLANEIELQKRISEAPTKIQEEIKQRTTYLYSVTIENPNFSTVTSDTKIKKKSHIKLKSRSPIP